MIRTVTRTVEYMFEDVAETSATHCTTGRDRNSEAEAMDASQRLLEDVLKDYQATATMIEEEKDMTQSPKFQKETLEDDDEEEVCEEDSQLPKKSKETSENWTVSLLIQKL
ncbi:hypothetical protein O6H91_07G048200 [Diphasiastrum complanatum]|uniref:Uncharacterized protein n=1 Tax=Diphasiastrum complanatum TaxID=34168 RepID=A0ACC2D554_DIPCM|nr:hypothetical protein O6H91_07G048200 [Diphasiastrum complanatum]